MKIVENENDCICVDCSTRGQVILKEAEVHCAVCGSQHLLSQCGGVYHPMFGMDQDDTYQASTYTPKLKNRRKNDRAFPIIRDRRNRSF